MIVAGFCEYKKSNFTSSTESELAFLPTMQISPDSNVLGKNKLFGIYHTLHILFVKKTAKAPKSPPRLPVTALALSARRLDKKDLPHTKQNLLNIACSDFCHQELVERRQRAEGRSMVWKMATATKRKKSSRGKKRSAFVYFHIISR